MNNWAEWLAGTDPTEALSVFRVLSVSRVAGGATLTWTSTAARTYFVERAKSPVGVGGFNLLKDNLPGQAGVMSFTDTNLMNQSGLFYRIGVRE